jgi:DNA repair photolyase
MAVITSFDPWKSPLCTCPKKYSLSPYTGCAHACIYCYISAYIPDAFKCRVKKNFIAKLRRDIRRVDPGTHVSMSNSSDPYTPPEDRTQLTRQALQILLAAGLRVQLITKSNLVVRDTDLIRQGNCSVSMTITTLNEGATRKLEPYAPSPKRRLDAVRRLTDEGIPCSVRIDPIIPWINNYDLSEVVEAASEAGARHVTASTYKAKRDSFDRVIHAFPELRERLSRIYWVHGETLGRARYLPKKLREGVLRQLKEDVEDCGMTYATCREGFAELNTAETCDGSHLIPIRRTPMEGIKRLN